MATIKRPTSIIRLSLAFVVFLFLCLVSVQSAAAHVLKQDHGISGVLHIPPEDTPKAGRPIKLNVSFADANNTFSLARCDCRVSIKLNGKVAQTVPLHPYFSGSTLSSTSTVQFPSGGVYQVIVRGTATDHSFPAFQLDFLVRVASDGNRATVPATSGDGASVVIVSAGSLAILALFAYVAISHGSRYKPKPKSK